MAQFESLLCMLAPHLGRESSKQSNRSTILPHVVIQSVVLIICLSLVKRRLAPRNRDNELVRHCCCCRGDVTFFPHNHRDDDVGGRSVCSQCLEKSTSIPEFCKVIFAFCLKIPNEQFNVQRKKHIQCVTAFQYSSEGKLKTNVTQIACAQSLKLSPAFQSERQPLKNVDVTARLINPKPVLCFSPVPATTPGGRSCSRTSTSMSSSTTTTSGRSEPQRPPPTHSYIWHIFWRALEASNLTEPLLWHHHLQTVPSYHACHLGGGAALGKKKKAFKLRRPLRENWMDECDDLKRFLTNNSKCLVSFLLLT